MAKKKPVTTTKFVPTDWEHNDELYPRKRGICEVCEQRDDLKLSFDRVHWICLNDSACLLRWRKKLSDGK